MTIPATHWPLQSDVAGMRKLLAREYLRGRRFGRQMPFAEPGSNRGRQAFGHPEYLMTTVPSFKECAL